MSTLPIVVLISGRGSNFKAIAEAKLPNVEIRAVVSNRADAGGLNFARSQGITTAVLEHKNFASREAFDTAMMAAIDQYQPKLVVLAGFMRILSPVFVQHYHGRLLNIHPSLLPAFKGLHSHERALEAKVKEHGASVHFVTEELDSGAVIAQARVPVFEDDTPDSLAARVLVQEHRLYPEVISWFAQGRLQLQETQALLDGKPIVF